VGGEFQVNAATYSDQDSPRVAADMDGDFVVAWTSYEINDLGVLARRFASSGAAAGGEFQVSSYTIGNQYGYAVAADAAGNFVIAWTSAFQDGNYLGVFAQRFSSAGLLVGSEFQVNSQTVADQDEPALAATAGGAFVVVWRGQATAAESEATNVFTRFYDSAGNALGDETELGSITCAERFNPDVCRAAGGDFVIVFEKSLLPGEDVFAQRFDSGGALAGTEFRVNVFTPADQETPSVACEANGDFAVAWKSEEQDDDDDASIFARRFDSAGAPLAGEFRVNTYTPNEQSYPSIASDADGDLVVVWSSYEQEDDDQDGVFGQRFSSSGAPVGTEFHVNSETYYSQRYPSVGSDADGDFVVAWQSFGQEGFTNGVVARRFNSAGMRRGSEFRVNEYTEQGQYRPSVAVEAEGDFVIAWASYGQDGGEDGVFAQRFDLAGGRIGAEFQVNTYTDEEQERPDVCSSAEGGNVVIAWDSEGQDGAGRGIFAQRYAGPTEVPPTPTPTPVLPPAGGEFQVNTHTIYSEYDPSMACDAEGNFVVVWEIEPNSGRDGVGVQRYDSFGNALGTELQLLSGCVERDNVSACRDMDGNTVAVWKQDTGSGEISSVYGLRFDSAGAQIGSLFQVNTYTPDPSDNPDVACAEGGEFVVVWQSGSYSSGPDGDDRGIFAQRFTSSAALLGSEFRVNSFTQSFQTDPAVTVDGDGAFVVVWESGNNRDGSYRGIVAQRFDSDGSPVGSEFVVNSYTQGYQYGADVAASAAGGFVVVWESAYDRDGSITGTFVQLFDSAGVASGGEFQANTYTVGEQGEPAVSMAADGRFVVAWQQSSDQDGGYVGVFAQRFESDGTQAGTEFQVNTYTIHRQQAPAVSVDTAGNFTIAWESSPQDGDYDGIFAQRFTSAGTQSGTEFQVNVQTAGAQYEVAVALADGGDFVVAWQGPANGVVSPTETIFLRFYDSAGAPLGGDVEVDAGTCVERSSPDVCRDDDGDFVVAYEVDLDYPAGDEIFAQRFTSSGAFAGSEFQVNTHTLQSQQIPTLACAADGAFVVAWESEEQDGSQDGVFAQRFASDGMPAGTEFQVNSYTYEGQDAAAAAAAANGDFVIVWSSDGQDGENDGVFGRFFASDGTPIGAEFQVNTYTEDDQEDPDVAANSNGDFIVAWESDDQEGDDEGIFAQAFDSGGGRVGSEFQVNTLTVDGQYDAAVEVFDDGSFVIVWESYGLNGGDYETEVFGQVFSSTGAPQGPQFQINTYVYDFQANPELCGPSDGDRFFVSWESDDQDGEDDGVFAQGFSADTPTPTATPSITPTQTPSATSTATATSTSTSTRTFTATATNTATATITPTITPTRTPTVTPTTTPTRTPTGTPTVTPTPVPTGPAIDGGAEPGSTVIGCTGSPNRPDGCIVICTAGPNGIFENCAMGSDDDVLGIGGTDAAGNCIDAAQMGIVLDQLGDLPNPPPPLQDGNLVCAVDRCGLDMDPDEAGAIAGTCSLVTTPAPVPALSKGGLAVVLALFAAIAAVGLLRPRPARPTPRGSGHRGRT
jgi:hypothetical protein